VSVVVGYTGGAKADPTYRALGDHTEAFQVEYDPAVISYRDLLERFWSAHDPCRASGSTQYKAAVWCHDEAQLEAAVETARAIPGDVQTEVLRAGTFYPAEDYHQKYYLRGFDWLEEELTAYYPDPVDLRRSTAAARINGVLGGHATPEQIEAVLPRLGLSPEATGRLREVALQRARRR